jgi:hypothetical protein
MAVIEQLPSGVTATVPRPGAPAPPGSAPAAPERGARGDLRAQIARLERELATIAAATYPRLDLSPVTPGMSSRPHVLDLGELELVRDALADRLSQMRSAALVQAEAQADAREELERMLVDPPAHRGRRLTNAELGLPGCTTYEVRPRFGVLGRLASWWQVKVSSGCPLVWGP